MFYFKILMIFPDIQKIFGYFLKPPPPKKKQ